MTNYESEHLWDAIEECAIAGWSREKVMREASEHWIEVKRRELAEAVAADNKQ